jgi:hypothetical protein
MCDHHNTEEAYKIEINISWTIYSLQIIIYQLHFHYIFLQVSLLLHHPATTPFQAQLLTQHTQRGPNGGVALAPHNFSATHPLQCWSQFHLFPAVKSAHA